MVSYTLLVKVKSNLNTSFFLNSLRHFLNTKVWECSEF